MGLKAETRSRRFFALVLLPLLISQRPPPRPAQAKASPPRSRTATLTSAAAAGSGSPPTGSTQSPSATSRPPRPPPRPGSPVACRCATAFHRSPKSSLHSVWKSLVLLWPPSKSEARNRPIQAKNSGGGVTAKANQRTEQGFCGGDWPIGFSAL